MKTISSETKHSFNKHRQINRRDFIEKLFSKEIKKKLHVVINNETV